MYNLLPWTILYNINIDVDMAMNNPVDLDQFVMCEIQLNREVVSFWNIYDATKMMMSLK